MFVINNNIEHEIVVKKSRFICFLYNVKNEEEIDNYLNEIKKEYKDARHVCYAYIIGSKQKATDDKEPQGTAGIPMLNLLKQKELTNILAIVVRYFGGIKLGTGGLFKAYTTVLKEAINEVELKDKTTTYLYDIKLDINNNSIDKISNIKVINKVYTDSLNMKIESLTDIDDILYSNNIEIINKEII